MIAAHRGLREKSMMPWGSGGAGGGGGGVWAGAQSLPPRARMACGGAWHSGRGREPGKRVRLGPLTLAAVVSSSEIVNPIWVTSMKKDGITRGRHEDRIAAASGRKPPDSHTTKPSWRLPIKLYLSRMSTASMWMLHTCASMPPHLVARCECFRMKRSSAASGLTARPASKAST